jgi:hypothetical protein
MTPNRCDGSRSAPEAELTAIAEDLELLGVPFSAEFAEMIRVSSSAEESAPSIASAEFMAEPTTPAEQTVGEMIYAVASLISRFGFDPVSARELSQQLAVYAARFETYLVERKIADYETRLPCSSEVSR